MSLIIKTRANEKFLKEIQKKLKKDKDMSKLLRASINNFFEKDLFNYISNIDTIAKVLYQVSLDLGGLTANFSQISNYLKLLEESEVKKILKSIKEIKKFNIENIRDIRSLAKEIKPFEKNYKKDNFIYTRVDPVLHKQIKERIEKYQHLKFDMSKFLRASAKYYLDKSYYELSEKQLKNARELIKISGTVAEVTNEINRIAFLFNIGKSVALEDVVKNINSLVEIESEVHQIVKKLGSGLYTI